MPCYFNPLHCGNHYLNPSTAGNWLLLIPPFQAHSTDVNCVLWHPKDPSLLAPCSDDCTIEIWKFSVEWLAQKWLLSPSVTTYWGCTSDLEWMIKLCINLWDWGCMKFLPCTTRNICDWICEKGPYPAFWNVWISEKRISATQCTI